MGAGSSAWFDSFCCTGHRKNEPQTWPRTARLRDLKVDRVDLSPKADCQKNSLHKVHELSPDIPSTPQASPRHDAAGDGNPGQDVSIAHCSIAAACVTDPRLPATCRLEVFPIVISPETPSECTYPTPHYEPCASMPEKCELMTQSPQQIRARVQDVASPMRIRRDKLAGCALTEPKELDSISETSHKQRSMSLPDPASVSLTLEQLSPWWTEANQLSEKLLQQREKWDQHIISGEGSPSKSRASAKHGDLPTPYRRRHSSAVDLLDSDDEFSSGESQ